MATSTPLLAPYYNGRSECWDTATPEERLVLAGQPDQSVAGQRLNALTLPQLEELKARWIKDGQLKRVAVYDGSVLIETLASNTVPTGGATHQLTVPVNTAAYKALGLTGQVKLNSEKVLARIQYGGILLPDSSTLTISHLAAAYDQRKFGAPGPVLPDGHLGQDVLENWVPGKNKVQVFVLETLKLNETRKNCNLTGFCIHGKMGLPKCILAPFQL